MTVPKYIDKKVDKLNTLLAQAYDLKSEIEKWASQKGTDVTSQEWYQEVIDTTNSVNGISKEALYEYMKNIL